MRTGCEPLGAVLAECHPLLFLEVVGGAVVYRVDVRLRGVPDVNGIVVGLPAHFERGFRASEMEINDCLRLVESVFLEVGWSGRTADQRLHLRALDAPDQSIDG